MILGRSKFRKSGMPCFFAQEALFARVFADKLVPIVLSANSFSALRDYTFRKEKQPHGIESL
jgi:hypothetical protein